jgi:hypothetical protein
MFSVAIKMVSLREAHTRKHASSFIKYMIRTQQRKGVIA